VKRKKKDPVKTLDEIEHLVEVLREDLRRKNKGIAQGDAASLKAATPAKKKRGDGNKHDGAVIVISEGGPTTSKRGSAVDTINLDGIMWGRSQKVQLAGARL